MEVSHEYRHELLQLTLLETARRLLSREHRIPVLLLALACLCGVIWDGRYASGSRWAQRGHVRAYCILYSGYAASLVCSTIIGSSRCCRSAPCMMWACNCRDVCMHARYRPECSDTAIANCSQPCFNCSHSQPLQQTCASASFAQGLHVPHIYSNSNPQFQELLHR